MLSIQNLIIFILLFPIIGILFLLLTPSRQEKLLKSIALNFACLSFTGCYDNIMDAILQS